MGIKKLSRKLAKLARKAAKGTGEESRRWVEAVFETAIGVVEERLQDARAKATRPSRPPRRRRASSARAGARSGGFGRTSAKAGAKPSPAPKRARPRRVAPRVVEGDAASAPVQEALAPEAGAPSPT